MSQISIEVSPDELEHITEVARQRGFDTVEDYIRSLIDADVEETAALEEAFKRAWRDAQQGNLLTEEEFWKALKDGD